LNLAAVAIDNVDSTSAIVEVNTLPTTTTTLIEYPVFINGDDTVTLANAEACKFTVLNAWEGEVNIKNKTKD
jgi:hypothetical protein